MTQTNPKDTKRNILGYSYMCKPIKYNRVFIKFEILFVKKEIKSAFT